MFRYKGTSFWTWVLIRSGILPTREEYERALKEQEKSERERRECRREHADEIEWDRVKHKYLDTDEPLTEEEKAAVRERHIKRLKSSAPSVGSPNGQAQV